MSFGRGLGVVVALWTAAQLAWLAADGRVVDGDELGIVGQAEIFWDAVARDGWIRTAWTAWSQTFGEYPSVAPALQGMVARTLGVGLGGDGLARLGLVLWGWPALVATGLLGRTVAGPRAGVWAAGLLACSPLFSGLLRHVLLEPAMAAAVVGAAAAGAAAVGGSGRQAWVACGLLAGTALIIKQTAALALLPLAGALLATAGWRALWALPAAAAVAGAFYAPRLAQDASYLFAAAGTNPDALPPWRQAAMYPLVLGQQALSPWLWGAVLGAGAWNRGAEGAGAPPRRDSPRRALILWLLGGALLLLLLPKKYPRLLLPLLPALFVLVGAAVQRFPRRAQAALAALAAATWLGSSFGAGSSLFAPRLGLGPLDERCPQRWVEPAAPGIDWPALTAMLEEAGGPGTDYRVGALRWPVPPCEHQTTQDLGEHLRVRMRWAGSEAWVMAGEDWAQAPGWPGGSPALLITDGPWSCDQLPAACGDRALESVGALPPVAADWPTAIHVWRLAP